MDMPMTSEEKSTDQQPKQSAVQKAAQKLSFLHYLAIGALAVCVILSAIHHH